tara:strand:- start:1374 stop:2339 length:966 start_codon:yes stop_codon:yes gene_type:complete
MAKSLVQSKTPTVISHTYDLKQPDYVGVEGKNVRYIDLTSKLSNYLGRNILQGNSVRVTGMSISMEPDPEQWESMNSFAGGALTGYISYVQPTKYRVNAWNQLFKVWREQQLERPGLAFQNTPNEFAIFYDPEHAEMRQAGDLSQSEAPINYCGGSVRGLQEWPSDGEHAHVGLLGGHDEAGMFGGTDNYYGVLYSYNLSHPTEMNAQASGVDLDTAISGFFNKFDQHDLTGHYDDEDNMHGTARIPFQVAFWNDTGGSNDAPVVQGWQLNLSGNQALNVMCGLQKIVITGFSPDDTFFSLADKMKLRVTWHVEGWKNLKR